MKKSDLQKMDLEKIQALFNAKIKSALIDAMANEKQFEARVKAALETHIQQGALQIAQEALGFSRGSFGDWEVDHCNGRKTPIANELGEYALQFARENIKLNADAIFPKSLAPKMLKALRIEAEEMVRECVHDKVMGHARDIAEELVNEALIGRYPDVSCLQEEKAEYDQELASRTAPRAEEDEEDESLPNSDP